MTVVDMFYKGEHKTPEGKLKIVKIKSGMNNKRTVYTSLRPEGPLGAEGRDHLQNFYNLKNKI